MAGVPNEALADLLSTTLEDLPNDEYEIMWDSHQFEFCQIYQKNRRKIDGGTSFQRNVILDRHGRARYRRLYDTDTPVVDQNFHEINVPWTQFGTDYSWDEMELGRNRSSVKGFINLIESRKSERMWDMSELVEERGWLTPTSASDKLYPYGIPYYLNFLDNGGTTGGFQGKTIRYQGGTTGTNCAGIDANLEPKWRNYADIYTKVDNGLLRKLRSAVRRTRFRPSPIVTSKGKDGVGKMVKLYTNDTVCTELEHLSDLRDDNNTPEDLAGKMLHSFDGVAHFNRMPVIMIDALEGVTVTDGGSNQFSPDPIYAVDWSKYEPYVQDGYWMKESGVIHGGTQQHTTFTVFNDTCHANVCTNRRTAGFVLHKAIPGS